MRMNRVQTVAIRVAVVFAPVALMTACASDSVYTGGDAAFHAGSAHFTQLGRAPIAPQSSEVPATAVAPPGVSVDEARRRVEAYLTQAGFQPESAAAAGLYTISGERMASAGQGDAATTDALCGLKALERPQMYTTHVDVRLGPTRPSNAGVQMGVEVKVVELDANLLSGALSKQTCRSKGLLEAAVRRAAFGG